MKPAENDLIDRLRRIEVTGPDKGQIRLGIGDDAALFAPQKGCETVLTCDWSLEGTHFLRDIHPPDSIGWKCLARAVSDLAAMGATPKCFLLSLALPPSHTGGWLDRFIGGLRRASRNFHCILAGGDTTQAKKILIDVTAIGEVPFGRAVLRCKASVGDFVYVSGRLGEGELGLRLVRTRNRLPSRSSRALRKHLYPQPRLALGAWLAERRLATSMMDLSDGLSTDLVRLCAASRVGARIHAASIPIARPAPNRTKGVELLSLALHGGEDYELLFTVSPRKAHLLPRAFRGIPLTRVGEITQGRRIELFLPDGRRQALPAHGWDPFLR
jgi:thiamine-monophosphate kinase